MNINKLLDNFHKKQFEKEWYTTYWVFDLHNTILKSKHNIGDTSLNYYDYAKYTLQLLSNNRLDIKLILHTSSYPHQIEEYIRLFKQDYIEFDYINENPEISNDHGHFGYYKEKFYFDLYFEDKAGFDPMEDWKEILNFLQTKEKPDPNWTFKY